MPVGVEIKSNLIPSWNISILFHHFLSGIGLNPVHRFKPEARSITTGDFMVPLEQRRAERTETRKAARIVLANGLGLRCVVRNLSRFGACLQVGSHFGVPQDIFLEIEGEQSRQPCQIVWRSNNRLGILFGTMQKAAVKAQSVKSRFSHLLHLGSTRVKKAE